MRIIEKNLAADNSLKVDFGPNLVIEYGNEGE